MKDLTNYIQEQQVDESVIGDLISLAPLKTMDPEHLKQGILNMYDYICDGEDINLFYEDFPVKERPLWINLYKLYSKKIWSLFDVQDEETLNSIEFDIGDYGYDDEMTKITAEVRRSLRQVINGSRMGHSIRHGHLTKDRGKGKGDDIDVDVKPGEILSFKIIHDDLKDISYLITINKSSNIFKKVFRLADQKFLQKAFSSLE